MTFKYTKDLQVLLKSMDASFNKSLSYIEKSNDLLINKVDSMLTDKFLNAKLIETNQESIKILDDAIASSAEENKYKLIKLKGLLESQYEELEELNEEVLLEQLREHVDSEQIKKFYYKETKEWGPGEVHSIVYKIGPNNILKLEKSKLKSILTKYIKGNYNNRNLIEVLDKAGIFDIKKDSVSEGFVDNIINLATEYN